VNQFDEANMQMHEHIATSLILLKCPQYHNKITAFQSVISEAMRNIKDVTNELEYNIELYKNALDEERVFVANMNATLNVFTSQINQIQTKLRNIIHDTDQRYISEVHTFNDISIRIGIVINPDGTEQPICIPIWNNTHMVSNYRSDVIKSFDKLYEIVKMDNNGNSKWNLLYNTFTNDLYKNVLSNDP
jgi:hypothetical protein